MDYREEKTLNDTNITGTYNTKTSEIGIFHREDVRIGMILAYTFVFICCFFGNLLVIIVIAVHRRMRTTTNFFLTNLAIADLCVGFFCVYQNLSLYLSKEWAFGDFMCKMYHFVHSMSYTASVAILTVICVERYVAIIYPIWSKHAITLRRLRIVNCGVWIVSALFCCPRLLMYGTVKIPVYDGTCEELCIMKRNIYDSKTYDMFNFLACFILPVTVISILYFIIGLQLWKSQRSLDVEESRNIHHKKNMVVILCECENHLTSQKHTKSEQKIKCCIHGDQKVDCKFIYDRHISRTILKARRKVLRLLIVIVLAFVICNLPFHARKLWQNWSSTYKGSSHLAFKLTIITTLAMYMNSGINPILYAFLSKKFRCCMKDILLCKCHSRIRRSPSSRQNDKAKLSTANQQNATTTVCLNSPSL